MFLLAQKRVHFYTIISDAFIDQPNFTQEVCYETNIKRPYDTDYNRFYDSLCRQQNKRTRHN